MTPPISTGEAEIGATVIRPGGQARPTALPQLAFALISDRGLVRQRNEDSACAFVQERLSAHGDLVVGLFLLADGMGGHAGGQQASFSAVQAASECLLREVILPLTQPSAEQWQSRPINEALEDAFMAANARVLRDAPGGGSTLTAVLLIGRRIYVGHVGDCRLYLIRRGALELLTRDHSLLNRLIELGQIEADDTLPPENDPRRNSLYQAIGQLEPVEIDFFSRTVEAGDGLLLCCDGLWSAAPAEELGRIIASAAAPAEACRRLVERANAAGGHDNITAILIQLLQPAQETGQP